MYVLGLWMTVLESDNYRSSAPISYMLDCAQNSSLAHSAALYFSSFAVQGFTRKKSFTIRSFVLCKRKLICALFTFCTHCIVCPRVSTEMHGYSISVWMTIDQYKYVWGMTQLQQGKKGMQTWSFSQTIQNRLFICTEGLPYKALLRQSS